MRASPGSEAGDSAAGGLQAATAPDTRAPWGSPACSARQAALSLQETDCQDVAYNWHCFIFKEQKSRKVCSLTNTDSARNQQ